MTCPFGTPALLCGLEPSLRSLRGLPVCVLPVSSGSCFGSRRNSLPAHFHERKKLSSEAQSRAGVPQMGPKLPCLLSLGSCLTYCSLETGGPLKNPPLFTPSSGGKQRTTFCRVLWPGRGSEGWGVAAEAVAEVSWLSEGSVA